MEQNALRSKGFNTDLCPISPHPTPFLKWGRRAEACKRIWGIQRRSQNIGMQQSIGVPSLGL